METPTCQNCGKDISDKRAGARFCGTSCRVSWNNKQKRRLEREKEEERKAAKKRLPDWILWIVRYRKAVLTVLVLSLLVIAQAFVLVKLYRENSALKKQLQPPKTEQKDSINIQ